MSTKGSFQKHSELNRVREFFAANPDEALSAEDVVVKFGIEKHRASVILCQLVREGLNPECFFRERQSAPEPRGEFPANLTRSERATVEAYAEHGTFKAVAVALGLSEFTIADNLKTARSKAGVKESVVLVAKYLRATLEAA